MKIKLTKTKILIGLVALMVVGAIVYQTMYKRNTAAYVNGTRISVVSINSQIESIKKREPRRFSGAGGAVEEKRIKRMLLDDQIARTTVGQFAIKDGIKVSEKEVDKAVLEMRQKYKSNAAFEKQLESEGKDINYVRELLHNVIAGAKMKKKLIKKVTVSKREIADYVKRNEATLERENRQVRFKVMILKNGNQAVAATKLLKASEGFDSTAKEIGVQKTTVSGWRSESLLDSNVKAALSKLDIGQHTEAIPNPDNTFSIYRVDERQTRKSTPEEISKQVRATLLRRKQNNSFEAWYKRIQEKTDVQILM